METINLEFKYTEAEAVRAVVELTKSTNKSIICLTNSISFFSFKAIPIVLEEIAPNLSPKRPSGEGIFTITSFSFFKING